MLKGGRQRRVWRSGGALRDWLFFSAEKGGVPIEKANRRVLERDFNYHATN